MSKLNDARNSLPTIIVAEDDSSIAEVITIILQDEGYRVHHATDYKNIHTLILKFDCKLLLLDLGLSGSDGGEICKKIKADEKTKNIPVVILSANIDIDRIAKSTGADDMLKKPFNIEDLLLKVKRFVT